MPEKFAGNPANPLGNGALRFLILDLLLSAGGRYTVTELKQTFAHRGHYYTGKTILKAVQEIPMACQHIILHSEQKRVGRSRVRALSYSVSFKKQKSDV